MTFRKSILLLIGLGMIAALVACSSSSNSSSTTTTNLVAIAATAGTPQMQTVGMAFATNLQATVTTNGTPTSGVSVTFTAPGSGASGTFADGGTPAATDTELTNSSGIATSTPFTANTTAGAYTVMGTVSGVPSPANFSLTNTAGAVAALMPVTGTTPQNTNVSTNFNTALAAQLVDGDNNPVATSGVSVTFTAVPNVSGASGVFTSNSTATETDMTDASGVATISAPFMANAIAGSYTVTATSGALTPATFSLTNTTVVASPLADGNYVFSLAGQNTAGDYLYNVAGVFTILNGVITTGEQDFTDYSGNPEEFDGIASGTVTTTTDGNIQILLTTCTATCPSAPDPAVGVSGVETLNATLNDSTDGFITEFDTSATSSGSLNLQNLNSGNGCSTAPCGYAFYLNGGDANGFPAGIGGVSTTTTLNSDGSATISGAGSVFDVNDFDLPIVAQAQPITSGTVSPADSFGRIQLSLVLGGTSGITGIGLVGYAIDGSRIRLIENGNDPNDNCITCFFGVTGGSARYQGSETGSFNAASIEGSSFVFGGTGQDGFGYLTVAGVLTTNVDGTTVSGTLNANDLTGTGVQAPEAFTGTYTVDLTGRVTISNITGGTFSGLTLQLYLSGHTNSFVLSMDSNDEYAGNAFLQSGAASSLGAANFSGNYAFNATGFEPPLFGAEFDAVGTVNADGVSSLTSTSLDENVLLGTPTSPISLTTPSNFSGASGGILTGTITGLDILNSTQDSFAFYLFDSSGENVAIETDPNQLTLGYFALEQ